MNDAVPRRKPRVEVVEYAPSHAALLAAFIRKVWDPGATVESVLAGRAQAAAANPGAVGGRIPTVLLLYDGEVVGHLTSIPERLSFGGHVEPASWTAGFHVLPEHRNGPIGVMVAREMAKVAPASLCTTVLDAPLRIFTALGWKHIGTVPNQLLVLDGAEFAQRADTSRISYPAVAAAGRLLRRAGIAGAAGAAAGMAIRSWAMHAGQDRSITTTASPLAAWGGLGETDAVWARSAPMIAASVVRDEARLRWRFLASGNAYEVVEARRAGRLVGWMLLKRPRPEGDERIGGLRLVPIVDLVYEPSDRAVLRRLVSAAAGHVREGRLGHALLASTPHAGTRATFRHSGFIEVTGNLHLVVSPAALPAQQPRFDEWWHARGDGDADQSF